jgi:hypothetical protein
MDPFLELKWRPHLFIRYSLKQVDYFVLAIMLGWENLLDLEYQEKIKMTSIRVML